MKRLHLAFSAVLLFGAICAHGQFVLTKEQMVAFTADILTSGSPMGVRRCRMHYSNRFEDWRSRKLMAR